jgi:mono/diheme cytochrome c family protein
MSPRRAIGIAVGIVGSLMVIIPAGCGSDRRDEPFTESVNLSDPKMVLGQKIFMRNCNQCHPGGSAGLGPSLNNRSLFAWYIKLKVRSGGGGMPAFSQDRVTDTQLDAVTEYLLELRALPAR